MGHREQWEHARSFLREAVERLAAMPRHEIARWPEWPQLPTIDLNVPGAYSEFQFTLMKDTLPDGTIRVAVQLYRQFPRHWLDYSRRVLCRAHRRRSPIH
jgi:hypothetical protein